MISAQEASEIILSAVCTIGQETVDLTAAHERVLAENIIATENIPPFDNSAMDGYAVCGEDVANPPVMLTLVGEVSAGQAPARGLQRGEAIRIMTGGQLPPGANAVVQLEWTEVVNDGRVRIQRPVTVGHNIRRAGEDIQEGQTVLEGGRELRAAELGVLASLGLKSVEVHRVPHVAILATGNELIEGDKPLEPGKIRNSNSYTLRALIKETKALPVDLGIARDSRDQLKGKILEGLASDALVTSGGVSVGSYDLVQAVMKELGVGIRFWKVNIKPGMPFLFGVYKGKPVFGLPGNPVSTMVTFLKFVQPAIQKMRGMRHPEREFYLRAELLQDIRKTDGKRHFVRGVLENQSGRLTVRTTGSQSSNVLTSLVRANCLILISEETEFLKKGHLVEVELL